MTRRILAEKLLVIGGLASGALNLAVWILRYPPALPVLTADMTQQIFGFLSFMSVMIGGLDAFDRKLGA